MTLSAFLSESSPLTVVTGHYGVGKTNLSLNLALDLAQEGWHVYLIDLDVVNPYFRSSDYQDLTAKHQITTIAPVLAGSSLDTPSISGVVSTVIGQAYSDPKVRVVIDAGGDDVGATALARFAPEISEGPYEMLYVVNAYRNLTQSAEQAIDLLREIEAKCNLKAKAVVNNSHLKQETTLLNCLEALSFGDMCAQQLGLSYKFATVPAHLYDELEAKLQEQDKAFTLYPVKVHVKTPWE